MVRTARTAATGALIALLSLGVAPTGAQEPEENPSSITVDGATVSGGSVDISGSVVFGDDLAGPVTVSTDGSGDATPPGVGLDIGDAAIATDILGQKLIFTLQVNDGIPVAESNAPATGYLWPIAVDMDDRTHWLAAGAAGTNFPPATSTWVGVCNNEGGGWTCPTMLNGSVGSTEIRWELPFRRAVPPASLGGTLDGGSQFCLGPCSFAWPSIGVFAGVAPSDTGGFLESYLIPGKVRLGIAPAGQPVEFTATATLNEEATGFTGSLAAPTAPGTYTVSARTCAGVIPTTTCVVGSTDITIE